MVILFSAPGRPHGRATQHTATQKWPVLKIYAGHWKAKRSRPLPNGNDSNGHPALHNDFTDNMKYAYKPKSKWHAIQTYNCPCAFDLLVNCQLL